MSTNEVVAGVQWLIATLSGDSTLMSLATGGVWRSEAPTTTQPIFIVVALQSGGADTTTGNRIRLLTNPLFQVKAVGPSSTTIAVAQVAGRIGQLLDPTPGATISGYTTGGYISSCSREAPLLVDEPLRAGVQWVSIGGLYRLQVQATS